MGAPSGTGSRASHEAADASSPKASIPSAAYAVVPPDARVAAYLTRGKAYRVERDNGIGFSIKNDFGTDSYCLWECCAHLRLGNWQRTDASAIEARSDATPKSGAAEGESAVGEAETPKGQGND